MSKHLTVYDTGERLEPRPWSLEHPDRYGLVDFDDDESSTAFTVVGKRWDDGSPGHLLSVMSNGGTPAVEVDGRRAAVTEEVLAGVHALVEYARRGHDDFLAQASETDDYTAEDYAAAEGRWALAKLAIAALTNRLTPEEAL